MRRSELSPYRGFDVLVVANERDRLELCQLLTEPHEARMMSRLYDVRPVQSGDVRDQDRKSEPDRPNHGIAELMRTSVHNGVRSMQ